MKHYFAAPWLMLMLMVVPVTAYSANAPTKNVPTNINADRMDYNADGQTVVFTGNVHVTRPDFELWSAKLTVYLDKSAKAAQTESAGVGGGMQSGDIDRIVAEKNVRMKSEDKEGTCEKATYYAKTDKFVMEGSPVLRDKDKSTITGKTVVHYINANRSEVQGGVNATFMTQDKTENSNPVTPAKKSKGK